MDSNVVGIIVCVAVVVCGLGAYHIGRLHGIEWVLLHIGQITVRRIKDDESRSDQTDG